jgi:hypothetical protein
MIREAEGKFEISVSGLARLLAVRASEQAGEFDIEATLKTKRDSPIALFQCESPSCPERGKMYALVGHPLESNGLRYGFCLPQEHIQCERRFMLFIPPDSVVLTIDKEDFVPSAEEDPNSRVFFIARAGPIEKGDDAPPLWLLLRREEGSLSLEVEVVHDPFAPSRKSRAEMCVHIENVGKTFRFPVGLGLVAELLGHLIALEEGGKKVFKEAPERSPEAAIIEGESRISVARIALTPRQTLETLKRLAGGGKGRGA